MTQPADTAEGPPTLAIDGPVATVRLRRPSQRNSLHDEDLHVLRAHFQRIDADASVRVMVLAAETAGQPRPVFSAGYHVGGFERGEHGPHLFEGVPEAIEALRPVTICALSGSVYGGATDLVLACDLRVARTGSEWRMPALALGLHYYPSGLRRYVTRLGLARAQRAFLTARAFPVEACADCFVEIADAERFESTVQSLARDVAALAPLAAQATKRSLVEIAAGDWNEARLRERVDLTQRSADFAEGRAAMAERRPPDFSGR